MLILNQDEIFIGYISIYGALTIAQILPLVYQTWPCSNLRPSCLLCCIPD